MKDKVIDILMDSLEKVKKKFDEAILNDQPFEASTYGGQLTDMSKELLAHYRAEKVEKSMMQLEHYIHSKKDEEDGQQ